eukprot:GEMP01050242.1.p2 GENE.GEMP01050242.1~~GEMP01050242.1.p2  ORF type:complete len:141 (+),score=28.67 GEMP01050242.1:393-815(+)
MTPGSICWRKCPWTSATLSRILLHDVPPPGAMTDGLVAALGVDKKLFDRAQRNHPDIAAIARGILVNNALPDRQPGVPCLATPVEEMSLEKALRSGPMAVEPKYDGDRLQIHFRCDGPPICFSRTLKDVTARRPACHVLL